MDEERKAKIGEGSLKAWLRQGGKELSQALPAFKDSIQVVEEPGMIGNATPHQVAKETGSYQPRTAESKEMDLER